MTMLKIKISREEWGRMKGEDQSFHIYSEICDIQQWKDEHEKIHRREKRKALAWKSTQAFVGGIIGGVLAKIGLG